MAHIKITLNSKEKNIDHDRFAVVTWANDMPRFLSRPFASLSPSLISYPDLKLLLKCINRLAVKGLGARLPSASYPFISPCKFFSPIHTSFFFLVGEELWVNRWTLFDAWFIEVWTVDSWLWIVLLICSDDLWPWGGGGAISHAPGCFASQQSVIELASAACGPIEVGDVIVSMAAFSYCGLSRK